VTGSGGAARGSGRGKMTMRRNAKWMISASVNSMVQFDDEAAPVVCHRGGHGEEQDGEAASQWRDISGGSRCA
jgi:hypothetical protein